MLITIAEAASVMGMMGGIAGMLVGSFAPSLTTGLYAPEGPEPPPTFNPVIWGAQKGTRRRNCFWRWWGCARILVRPVHNLAAQNDDTAVDDHGCGLEGDAWSLGGD